MNPPPDSKAVALSTDRLMLRPIATPDVPELLEVFQDSAVRRYLLDDQLVARSWVAAEVEASEQRFTERSAGIWSIRIKPDDNQPIMGFVGFRPFFDPPQLQLLYGLLPTVWGRGYATEASRAVIQYGFAELDFQTVVAATDTPNQASIQVMQRLGMKFDPISSDGYDSQNPADHLGTVYYRLVRESETN